MSTLPQGILLAYACWEKYSAVPPTAGATLPFYLQNLASSLLRLSVGFALAFFPAILDSLRHPDERNAA